MSVDRRELFYDGATKRRELLVSNSSPIPYRVDVVDGSGNFLGTATDIIRRGFDHWLPVIWQLRILAGRDREDEALREVLFPGQVLIPAGASFLASESIIIGLN